jgi:aryl-alcohol dehydrogenase-like predicted oxidoreductase
VEQRNFGKSDLVSSAVGFGTWEMSTTQYGHIDVGEVSKAINLAIDRGVKLIDTAEVYGPYHAEEILGKALGAKRKDIVLVTKVGFEINQSGEVLGRNSKRESVIAHTEGCLKRLGTDWIDLMLIHWPDHDTPFEEPMTALEELKSSGKIRHYGVSNFTVQMMEECSKYGELTSNQVGYCMYDRRMEAEVLPYCREKEIGFMAYGTLGYGLLTGAFTPDTTFKEGDWRSDGKAFGLPLFEKDDFLRELKVTGRLKEFASGYGKSVAQLAIAWVIANSAVSVALVGMRNPTELEENIQAVDWKLTPEDMKEIDRIFEEENVPTYQDADQAV